VSVYLVQDAEGRIVGTVNSGVRKTTLSESGPSNATVPPGEDEAAEVAVEAIPLPGQTVHEVDLPSELEHLEGAELLEALMNYEVKVEKKELVLRGSGGS
jgi:hypothetical protein